MPTTSSSQFWEELLKPQSNRLMKEHKLQNATDLLSDMWFEPIFLTVPVDENVFGMLFVKLLVLVVKKEIPLLGNLLGKVSCSFSPHSQHLCLKKI